MNPQLACCIIPVKHLGSFTARCRDATRGLDLGSECCLFSRLVVPFRVAVGSALCVAVKGLNRSVR